MHEHVPMSMRDKFLVHWRANVGMLKEKKILALSSFIAILPSLVFGLALWYFDRLLGDMVPAMPRFYSSHESDRRKIC